VATLAAVLAVLGAFAATARADNASDAAAVADKFVVALVSNDGATACSLLSPRALAALGGPEKCPPHFAPDSGSGDYDALETLSKAFAAARRSSAARRGDFVRKRFTLRQLARDMERIDSDLTVKLGKGAKAAAGQLATTAILDTRTNARRVVIYAEGDSGAIYRVTGTAFTDPRFKKVAQGIAEAPKPPPAAPQPLPLPPTLTHTVNSVAIAANGTAFVSETIADSSDSSKTDVLLELVPSPKGYLVDDAFISLVSILQLADQASGDLGSGEIIVVGP
jgi:hypothetical protein